MLTWKCDICGLERPDAKISVNKKTYPIADTGGATMTYNVKYCNDDPDCELAAILKESPHAH